MPYLPGGYRRFCVVQIKKAGCTVLLVQKSILRDAYNDLSIHFLAKVSIHTACSFGTQASFFLAFPLLSFSLDFRY